MKKSRFGVRGLLVSAAVLLAGVLMAYVTLYAPPASDRSVATAGSREEGALKDSQHPGLRLVGYSDVLDDRTFDGTNVGGLSALTYDPRRDLYYALVDREEETDARFYTLRIPFEDGRLGGITIFDVTELLDSTGRPFGAGRFDGEGLDVTSLGNLLVASETGPAVFRFSLEGDLLEELPVPEKFLLPLLKEGDKIGDEDGGGQPNSTFEGLSLTPDGDTLFVALQKSLTPDSRNAVEPQRLRLLRYERRGLDDFRPSGEFFYMSDSLAGIGEIAAVSKDELLVLEHGNQLFRTNLSGAEDVSESQSLLSSAQEPLEKELVADLRGCVPQGESESPDSQADTTPTDYEGMTFGPSLPSGGRALVLVSDDDFDGGWKTRVLALDAPARSVTGKAKDVTCR
jgi:hypothetical protein